MTNSVGSALGFYFRNAKEVDVLSELMNAPPKGVDEEDWRKFEDVMARASTHVKGWLDGAREEAVKALAAHVTIPSRSRKPMAPNSKDWNSWAELLPKKPMEIKKLYLGVCIIADDEGKAYLGPYFSTDASEFTTVLADRLKAARLAAVPAPAGEWWGEDAVALALIPLDEKSDIGAATAASTACFVAVAKEWAGVFGQRASTK